MNLIFRRINMKTLAILALVVTIVACFCACRMGQNQETTPTPDTQPPVTTAPEPTETEPTMPDITIAPNVPDPDVDNDHLIDPTEGDGATENQDGILPDMDGRLTSAD